MEICVLTLCKALNPSEAFNFELSHLHDDKWAKTHFDSVRYLVRSLGITGLAA